MNELYSDNLVIGLFQKILTNSIVRFGTKSVMEFLPIFGGVVNNAIDELVPNEMELVLKTFKETTEKEIEEIKEKLNLTVIDIKLLMLEVENSILRLKLEQIKKPYLEIRDVSIVKVKKTGKKGTSCEFKIRIMNFGENTALVDLNSEFNPIIEFDIPWEPTDPYSYYRDYDPTYDENERTVKDLKITAGDDINISLIFVFPTLNYYKWYRGEFKMKITLHNPEVKGHTIDFNEKIYRFDAEYYHYTMSLSDEDFDENGDPIK